MADFIPRGDGEFIPWLTNYKTKLGTYGVTLGLTAGDVTALQGQIDAYITQHNATEEARRQAAAAVTLRTGMKSALLTAVRTSARSLKANKNYKPNIGEEMQIIGGDDAFDPATYKPAITVQAGPGEVVIGFRKLGVDGLSIYTRLRGEPGWTFLARDTVPPYVDNRPLAKAGQPETREYMARGVIGDDEIGLESDIVSAVFGG